MQYLIFKHALDFMYLAITEEPLIYKALSIFMRIYRIMKIRLINNDFYILKFRISLEFFFLSIQIVTIYLHGCGYSGIYIAFNLFILRNLPRSITLFYCPNLILVLVPTIFNTYFPY